MGIFFIYLPVIIGSLNILLLHLVEYVYVYERHKGSVFCQKKVAKKFWRALIELALGTDGSHGPVLQNILSPKLVPYPNKLQCFSLSVTSTQI